MELYCARQRRAFTRGTKRKHNALLKRLRKVTGFHGLVFSFYILQWVPNFNVMS